MQTEEHDVVIVGAGPTGLALAIALAQAALRVAIVDTQAGTALAAPAEDGREIALAHSSVGLLQRLGFWAHLRPEEIGCIREARVVDGGRHDRALRFDAAHSGHAVLSAIVPNQALRRAGHAVAVQLPQIRLLPATRATLVRTHTTHAQVLLAPEGPLPTDDHVPAALHGRVVVAADSRFSPTRRQLGVGAAMHDFGRSMIMCRMAHDLPHHEIAHECFGGARTLAMLPLPGRVSSVVLTSDTAGTASLMALSEAQFCALVQEQFSHRLGAMRFVSPRHVYPLIGAYAERFTGHRFALAGDAAVALHPLTAQGHNLSLQGVESLARILTQARAAGRDIGHAGVLAAYERQHRRETALIYHGSKAVAGIFAGNSGPHRLLRHLVLEGARRLPPLQWAIRRQITGPAAPAR